MIVGGGNSAGYAARTFVEHGVADGRLCIVTKEVIIVIIFLQQERESWSNFSVYICDYDFFY